MTTLTVPGLLLDGAWIPPIRVYGGATKSLVDIVCSEVDSIFPGFLASRFDLSFAQELEDPLNVDLVLISKDYDAWYLVLVQPSRDADLDSLTANLRTMSMHQFGGREARYLETQVEGVDIDRVSALVNEQPKLLVITDDPRNDWSARFSTTGVEADIMIIEPFQLGAKYVLRVNGKCPRYVADNVVGLCNEHPGLANCLVLVCNNLEMAPDEGELKVKYGDVVTRWQVLPGSSDLFLVAKGAFPLQEKPPFEMILEADGTHTFRKP